MSAPHVPRTLRAYAVILALVVIPCQAATTQQQDPIPVNDEPLNTKKMELFDGVSVEIPRDGNSTGRLMSFEIDTSKEVETGRGKQKKLLQRILPMFIMPFLIQSTIVPFFLSMLKFMLFKSLMVGKMALGLILFNAFKNHNSVKGRHDEQMANVHYGYNSQGMEYGAYFN